MDPLVVFASYDTLCTKDSSESLVIIELIQSAVDLLDSESVCCLETDAVEYFVSVVVMMIVIVVVVVAAACALFVVLVVMVLVLFVIVIMMMLVLVVMIVTSASAVFTVLVVVMLMLFVLVKKFFSHCISCVAGDHSVEDLLA